MSQKRHSGKGRPRAVLSCGVFLLASQGLAFGLVANVGAAQQPPTEFLPMEGQPVPGLERIRVDEHLDDELPLDARFRDHRGREVRLGDYFDGDRPVLLNFAYHSCPTLCSMVLSATVNGIKPTEWTAGDEYQVVTISIDPRDSPAVAARKRRGILEEYGRLDADADGWAFLVGEDEEIRRVAGAVGYHYFWDGRQQQFGHPAAIMLASPSGKIARYLYGLTFDPNDIRLGLLEASEGRSISTGERFLLYCYAYNPDERGYTLVATRIMRVGGALTVLVLGAFLFGFWRREKKRIFAARKSPGRSAAHSDAELSTRPPNTSEVPTS